MIRGDDIEDKFQVRSADDTVTTVEMPISMSKLTPGWADVVGTVIGGRLMYSRMAQYEKLEGNRAFSHECYIQAVEIFNRLVLKAEEI